MGIYDRDYYRSSLPHGGFGHFNAWSVTTWLIVLNVAVFFVDAGLFRAAHGAPRDPWTDQADEESVDDPQGPQGPRPTRLSRPTPEQIEAQMIAGMGPLQRWGYFS